MARTTTKKVIRKRSRPAENNVAIKGSFKFTPTTKSAPKPRPPRPEKIAGPALRMPPKPNLPEGINEIIVPCPEIGEGWMQQLINRKTISSYKTYDRKFITPCGKKFRGMPEVNRFLKREELPRNNCWVGGIFRPPTEVTAAEREKKRAEVAAAKAQAIEEQKEAERKEYLSPTGDSKYAIGTPVAKNFYDEDIEEERPFDGEILGYDIVTKLYSVVYEDGDEEEMNEADLEKIIQL